MILIAFKNKDYLDTNQSFKMKRPALSKITILSFISVVLALDLTPRDLAKYDQKLRSYQNMTGIDEETFNEIWETGISNRKFQRTIFRPKFKLAEPLTSILSGKFCSI